MKTFRYVPGLPEKIKLEKFEVDGKRTYILPSGAHVPSITTVLGHFKKKSIAQWRAKVGNEEANRISSKAAGRGTRYHNMIERYLENQPPEKVITESTMPDLREMFKIVLPTLDRIDNIHYVECPLFSEKLGVAGRCDLIAEFDGKLSIIDHKTSVKEKREEWIIDYLEQKTAYGMMYEEWTGIKVPQIVTIIVCDDLNTPQIFIRDPEHYKESLLNKIEQYSQEQRKVA
jgi:genome maintenance exonuclease 1